MILRPYQQTARDSAHEKWLTCRSTIIVMATGALDTAMAIYCTQCTAEKSMCLKDFRGLTTDEIAHDLITGWNRKGEIVGVCGKTTE